MLKTKTKTAKSPYDLAKELLEVEAVDGFSTIWHVRGHWHVWMGTHYAPVCGEMIEQRVLGFLKQRSPDLIRRSRIRNIVELLRIIQHRELDKSPCWLDGSNADLSELFAVRNGLLRLSIAGCKLLPHDPNLFGTAAVAYDYLNGATCPRWTDFLDQLWPHDAKAKETLQSWFGYCLLNDTSQQKLVSIVGPPRSGKSTIARVLTHVLGPTNVACPSIRDLSTQFGLWGLLDKKLAIISDAVLPRPCSALEELLKSVSGEDAVDIHRKGLPPLTGIRLTVRMMMLANELPAFHDPTGALDRRMITLRTSRSFFGVEDVSLTQKLLKELPGILNWAIEGMHRLTAEGRFTSHDDSLFGKEQVDVPLPEPTSMEAESVSDIVAKLQQGRKAMAERCQRVGKTLLDEAGVQEAEYHTRLGGWAYPDRKSVRIPNPTTRRRVYILAHEAGHVALNHCGVKPKHRQEYEAERYAHDALRRHGIAVPKKF